jgi:soluble lytic murein transglycosylase-like protein
VRRGPRLAGAISVLTAALLGAAPGQAEVVRLVDEEGVLVLTNEPCQPRYARLAAAICDSPAAAMPAPPPAAPAMTPPPGSASAPFAREIAATAARHGVDPRLVEAVVRVESGGQPQAVSPKGARGLMQLMPARAAALGIGDAFDPAANLDGGVRHLRDLLARYSGDLSLALAAYNAGEEAVRLHRGVPPYRETRDYVRKVMALYGTDSPSPAGGAKPARPSRPRL